eukprot:4205305-Pyramimonas_sp.AAC.1
MFLPRLEVLTRPPFEAILMLWISAIDVPRLLPIVTSAMVIGHLERAAALPTNPTPFPLGIWQGSREQRRAYLHQRFCLEVVLQRRR